MTNTELLRQAIEEKGVSITFIAKKLGLSRSGLYKKINNQSRFDQFEINVICDVLDIKSLKVKESIFFC